MINMIVAVSKNNQIGANNALPWDIKEDMKFFRTKTAGKTVIMGRKTYESIGKALPNRKNVILTTNEDLKVDGATIVTSFEEALKIAKEDDTFIIGGGEIYNIFMPHAEQLFITQVDTDILGDTTFPEYKDKFRCIEIVDKTDTAQKLNYKFSTWVRI